MEKIPDNNNGYNFQQHHCRKLEKKNFPFFFLSCSAVERTNRSERKKEKYAR
jgi:hypothetical protein